MIATARILTILFFTSLLIAGCRAETVAAPPTASADVSAEILVFGSAEETRAWLESQGWWGDDWRSDSLEAPHVIMTGIPQRWRLESQSMPVENKKEAFFRFMLPLVLHANELVLDRRKQLETGRALLEKGESLDVEQLEQLRAGAVMLRVLSREEAGQLDHDDPGLTGLIDEMLYRLDIVPPGLALGQAAYESGWGTSRFAREGNALFGQWTYGGDGMAPKQQRSELGNYGIAAYEWPFDSVRGYFINLASHPAYEDFRRLRAQRRAAGESLDSLHLADGLLSYSERGQDYVDSLKSLIRYNGFDNADNARFRDEPLRFFVSAESPEEAEELKTAIESMREQGQLKEIYDRMRLE